MAAVLAHGDGGLPPEPDLARWLLHWTPDLLPMLGLGLAAVLYLAGVRRLRARGAAWSPWRTGAWLLGLVVVAYALLGGVADYDTVLFSAHAVQHMLLAGLAPVPLALGAPVTLALRTLPVRPRRALVALLHSRVARVLSFPVVGFAVLIVSMYGLYFTSLYEASLRDPVLHAFVHVHFLLAGCLFYWPVIGVDPLPKLAYWARLVLLFVTFPVHALLALALMSYEQVLAADWYAGLGRTWGASALTDQRAGAGIMWAAGELIGALVFVALFVQWSRAEGRQSVREDRRADRLEASGEDELAAYNAMLARLAAREVPGRRAT